MSGRATPHQRASLFFPEVREELTRSWRATYSARLHASSSSALTSVDGTKEKGYGKPRYGPLGQHDRGGLYKSPKRALLEAHLHFSGTPLGMGTAQPVFAQSNSCARQTEPGRRHVVTEQHQLRRVDSPSARGSGNMGDLWRGRDRPLRLKRQLSYYLKDMDAWMQCHDWPNLLLYAFPPIALITQVIRWIREHKHKYILVAPLWRNQYCFSELSQLLTAAPWPITLRRDLLSQVNRTMWHPRLELWALHLWTLDGSSQTSLRAFKTQSLRLEPRLRDASMPLNDLFLPPGAQPASQTQFPWNIADIVLPTRAVGQGTLSLHAQGLCSSYSSLTRSYSGPVGEQEQPSCSFSERVQEAEAPSPLPNPYLGSDHCSEGSEGPSLWAATVYWPTIPVTKDSPATGASIGQVDGWFTCTLCEFHLPSIWA